MSDRVERIRNVVSNVLDVPLASVSADTKAEDVENWDSLGQMNVMLALEEEFGVNFAPEQIMGLLSIQAIESALREKE